MTKKKISIEIETEKPEVEYLLASFKNICKEYGIKYSLTSDDMFIEAKHGTIITKPTYQIIDDENKS